MVTLEPANQTLLPHWGYRAALCFMLGMSAGCATFWDEALSHERDWAYITGIGKPPPLVVIRDNADGAPNSDGHRRAQAFGALREPLQNGGNAEDQAAYLNILGAAAKRDSEPLCRLAAVRALGKFKDPRAARVLEEVYQLPTRRPGVPDDGNVLFFTADINSMVRKEALVALEQSHDDEARHLLMGVARGPGPAPTADLGDRQQTQDEKIVAIRALRHYRHPECVETLKYVLRTEKDIALRDRAVQSLEETTGKRWPIELAAWQKGEPDPLPRNDGFIQTVTGFLPK